MKKETFEKMTEKRGVIFKVKEKKTATSPDYTGSFKFENELYLIAGWINESKTGLKYISISVDKSTKPLEDLNTSAIQASIVPVNQLNNSETLDDLPF
jgi:hypothetical protein